MDCVVWDVQALTLLFVVLFYPGKVDVSHPAAKSMIELSRAQDEEVGDGTTSVIILSECSVFVNARVRRCPVQYQVPCKIRVEIVG